MIVHQDDRTTGCHNDGPKDLTSMNEASVQTAQRDQVVAQDASAGVEDQDDESFLARVIPIG